MNELLNALNPYVIPMTILSLGILIRLVRNSVDYIDFGDIRIKFRKGCRSHK